MTTARVLVSEPTIAYWKVSRSINGLGDPVRVSEAIAELRKGAELQIRNISLPRVASKLLNDVVEYGGAIPKTKVA